MLFRSFNVSSCVCERGFRLADGSFVGGREDADAYGCVLCHAGNFCPGNGTSRTCPLNMWSAVRVNAGPCDACAVRSFAMADAGMRSPDMCQCVAGAEGTADNNCSLCAAGSFQPCDFSQRRAHSARHNASCMAQATALGNRSAATTMRCEPCPPNFYSDASGADSCSACPANASSPARSEARSRCRCNAAFTGPAVVELAVVRGAHIDKMHVGDGLLHRGARIEADPAPVHGALVHAHVAD